MIINLKYLYLYLGLLLYFTEKNLMDGKEQQLRILVGVTGSVASIKLLALVAELQKIAEVRIVSTAAAEHFWKDLALPQDVRVYKDIDEWNTWQKMGDAVLHIELRRWANIFVVAPLDANTMAKIAHGQCDNLLTCVARCWDVRRGTMIVAPAMNTFMWDHPITEIQVQMLRESGIDVINPIVKKLACGDIGTGAMVEVSTIVERVNEIRNKFCNP